MYHHQQLAHEWYTKQGKTTPQHISAQGMCTRVQNVHAQVQCLTVQEDEENVDMQVRYRMA